MNAKTYEGIPCPICASTTRYKRTNYCYACVIQRAKLNRECLWGKAKILYMGCKKRASETGLLCTITEAEILEKLLACDGFCPITGDAFSLDTRGTSNAYTPSLDQIVPGKGYTTENVQIVVWWYNAAKGNWFTEEEARSKFGKPRPVGLENILPVYPQTKGKVGKLGYRGVEENAPGRFTVRLKDKHIGVYSDPHIAARVYDKKASELQGQFDRRIILNFPNEPLIDEIPTSLPRNYRTNANPHRSKQEKRKSTHKGVHWVTSKGLWAARISKGKTKIHLGYFRDEEEAAQRYREGIVVWESHRFDEKELE